MQTQVQLWLSKKEIAQRYGVSSRSIERWSEAGVFPRGVQHPSGRWFWKLAAIEQYERDLVRGGGGVGDIGGAEAVSA